jgi:hypothetical protein
MAPRLESGRHFRQPPPNTSIHLWVPTISDSGGHLINAVKRLAREVSPVGGEVGVQILRGARVNEFRHAA